MKALICGVSGQDGAYLSRFLLGKGYEVYGASRDAEVASFKNLVALGIRDRIKTESVSLVDFRSVLQCLLKVEPDEVYNLAGQSSVGLSFHQPVETFESIMIGALNLLEAIRFSALPIKLYNACSSECFGETNGAAADETTPFRPRSPYAVAKAAAFWEVANYREAYGLFACSGILFNHESPLRGERFVTQKIVAAARSIARHQQSKVALGNTDIRRDWGWAPEYVEAMWLMLQHERPEDFVVATGETRTLAEFASEAFEIVGLNWREHVAFDASLLRPSDLASNSANPTKVWQRLGWQARFKMKDVVRLMMQEHG